MPSSTPINWFPGHMNRARREITAAIQKVHVVIELVDARLPHSSRNPLLHQLSAEKPVLTILAKADLADPETTAAWLDAWPGERPLALSMGDHKGVRAVLERCRELAPSRGGPGRTLRTLVAGIPNVGKSTLINTLIGRRIAKVGDRPASSSTRISRSSIRRGCCGRSSTTKKAQNDWPRVARSERRPSSPSTWRAGLCVSSPSDTAQLWLRVSNSKTKSTRSFARLPTTLMMRPGRSHSSKRSDAREGLSDPADTSISIVPRISSCAICAVEKSARSV